jgi:hypothetical protein
MTTVSASWMWTSCLVGGISFGTVDTSKRARLEHTIAVLGQKRSSVTPGPVVELQFSQQVAQNARSGQVLDVDKLFGAGMSFGTVDAVEQSPFGAQIAF